jgi:hypothetical protein
MDWPKSMVKRSDCSRLTINVGDFLFQINPQSMAMVNDASKAKASRGQSRAKPQSKIYTFNQFVLLQVH